MNGFETDAAAAYPFASTLIAAPCRAKGER